MDDLFGLSERHALVTGAGSGLGAHFAEVLARRGARVTLCGRRNNALEDQVRHLREQGHQAQSMVLDVTDQAAIKSVLARAEAEFGIVDILLNNAGITVTKKALELEPNDFDPVLDTNLRGAWHMAQACAQRLIETDRQGSIINIASILGERVAGGVLAYCVAKAGLVQLTKALALEWARHGIRVNALAPGYIATDINRDFMASDAGLKLLTRVPQRRLGQMTDLDGPLLLLAADAGRFMTGAVIPVDGGHLVSSL